MAKFIKIVEFENELEARLIVAELESRKIPFVLKNYHDFAYDGIFQAQKGWGHLEAKAEDKEEILTIYKDLLPES